MCEVIFGISKVLNLFPMFRFKHVNARGTIGRVRIRVGSLPTFNGFDLGLPFNLDYMRPFAALVQNRLFHGLCNKCTPEKTIQNVLFSRL